ncbi:PHD finger protein 20-like protein 1-like, partial [Scleropages formosus]
MLVHFDRWSHRYDEWIFWDSDRLRPLEKPMSHKVGQNDKEEASESLSEITASRFDELPGSSESTEDQTELQQRQNFKDGEEVLARWTDCRYYPAKIETIHDDGTYTVQFYDGVIRCVKRIHIKSMPEDAKGQDWIALVKAATDAAKGKGGSRPRTTANSKAKETRKTGAVTGRCESEAEDDLEIVEDPAPDAGKSVINMKRSDGSTSPKELLMDLDHNKFRCRIPGCGKAFRKAKLLDYHLKYYHNADKEAESEAGSPEGAGRARAASASMPTSSLLDPVGSKRRRTVSSSSWLIKTEKKIKLEEIQTIGKRKDKDKERKDKKEKFPFRIKQKKKKKKKKKSKQHIYEDFEDVSLAYMRRCSSPLNHSCSTSFRLHSTPRHTPFQYPRAILSVDLTGENLSDMDSLADSTTESALLSGDEYRAADSSDLEPAMAEEEEYAGDIVRCICEMDEENGFMIQCEECMCWQHSVCMGLLEDCIPDQYVCYVCQDPPGQRLSAKYRHDKDWMTKGHMYGLSFLAENYSHSNAEKIVSTHQLMADVYSVSKVLHGLHLKMDILQNKHNPNLHLWTRSWVRSGEDSVMDGLQDHVHLQAPSAHMDTYITSEHSYQKPPGPGPKCDRDAGMWPGQGALLPAELIPHMVSHTVQSVVKEEEELTVISVPGFLNENFSEGSTGQVQNCLQWQLNLLAHIEDVQSQLAGRMDLIEKELDVLESWLDFTGELEPPDPLARLPQLKRRVKQLLTDLE